MDANTGAQSIVRNVGGATITGGPMTSNAGVTMPARLEDRGDAIEERDRVNALLGPDGGDPVVIDPGDPRWQLKARHVNHLAIGFYAYREAKNALA